MAEMDTAGVELLKQFEGCYLFAYDDANDRRVEPGDPVHGTLTIGYGHTGSDVFPGLTWTQEQAEEALTHDIDATVAEMSPLLKSDLNDNQFSAFVCFAFNIGVPHFAGSSALQLANSGHLADVPAHIALWDKTTVNNRTVVSAGLKRRRAAEIELWNTPVVSV